MARSTNINSTLVRTSLISGLMLAGLFVLIYFLEDNFANLFGRFADEVSVGLMLFALWLVVSSAVRSGNRLHRSAGSGKLLLVGLGTALAGSALFVAFLEIFPNVGQAGDNFHLEGAGGKLILVLLALALLISLLTIVNTRVKNRTVAGLLEVVIVGGAIAGFIWLVSQ